jgi:G:T/U-mismatch repair DNA glycosylase
MPLLKHKMHAYALSSSTEILIVGTFNPDVPSNPADFFYGRSRNFLWRLLPTSFGENDLKGKSKEEKMQFMENRKIGFIDLISEVNVEAGQETNYKDDYIDSKVTAWRDVISEISKLENLKMVCFTRKTLSGIPNIKTKILSVEKYCGERNIPFRYLETPARIYSKSKQNVWTKFLSGNFD